MALVPEAVKLEWQRHLAEYLQGRRALRGLVLVMDVRHPLTEFDQTLLGWADDQDMPVHILLTKADKLKRGQERPAASASCASGLVTVQLFSSLKREGVEEACARLDVWLADTDGA